MTTSHYFTAGPPVTGEHFYGRKSLMESLHRHVEAGSSVVLIGERRIGKTSVLHEFRYQHKRSETSNSETARLILIEAGSWMARGDDKQWLSKEISHELIHWSEHHSDKASSIIHRTLDFDSDQMQLIRCLRRIREEDIQIALLFDEVDAAVIDGSSDTPGLIRAIATEGHLTLLATSYLHPAQLEVGTEYGRPWFGFLQFQYIGLFEDQEADFLLSTVSEKSGRRFTPAECAFLRDVFGNFPYYLQLAGTYIFDDPEFRICNEGQRTQVLQSAVSKVSHQLEMLWAHSIRYLPDDLRDALLQVAHHKRLSSERHLQTLMDRGLVVAEKGKHRVYSRAYEGFLRQLPDKSVLEKAKGSKTVELLASMGRTAIDVALREAIEIAAQTYLGSP